MAKRGRGADEFLKKKKEIRHRFRRVVRLVEFNRMWLHEPEEGKINPQNYRKHISSMVRNEQKVGLLTLAEKGLLRTEHGLRSIADRKKLVTLIAGLPCFARIPPKVRARLVPVIKFLVLKPGKLLIKQGFYPPLYVYYIVSGEVEVIYNFYNPLTKSYEEKTYFFYRGGDCFGDTEMFENIPRRFSYRTITDVELLVVCDDDFNQILRPVCFKDWENKMLAIKSLGYFNFFTRFQLQTGCKFGKIKQYNPLETIYHEDRGPQSHTFFILSGECMILQCLRMRVKMKGKLKTFELVHIGRGDEKEQKTGIGRRMMVHDDVIDKAQDKKLQKEIDVLEHLESKKKSKKLMLQKSLKDIEEKCGSLLAGRDMKFDAKGNYQGSSKMKLDVKSEKSFNVNFDEEEEEEAGEEEELENGEEEEQKSLEKSRSSENRNSTEYDFLNEVISQSESEASIEVKDPQIENRFFDVGSLTFGGIFGLGEKYEDRVIMARTTVQCLLLPRFWLFERAQNPGNMWQKKRLVLNTAIPSRQQIFENFLKTRKWRKFKNAFVQSNLDHDLNANPTKVQDIPMICRIVEPDDE